MALNLDIIDKAFHSIVVDDGGASLTVDGTVELGATSLSALENITATLDAGSLSALENITVQNGAGAAAVNIQDGGNSITVDAADLDIRNLVFADDKVDVSGSEVSLDSATLAALENITVDGTVELGATTLAALESVTVQNGAGASAVNIQDGGNSITVDGTVTSIPGGFATWSVSALSVTSTESSITALGSRLKIEMQNLGTADIWIRHITGVSAANGFKIPKGGSWEQQLAAGASIFMITASGTADLRVAQYAI